MNYMLTERAARGLAKLLKASGTVVAAEPGETRKTRPDSAAPIVEHAFKVNGVSDGWRINLPPGCVAYGADALTPSGVTLVSGTWYTVTDAGTPGTSKDAATPLYLVIEDGTGGATAKITGDSTKTTGDDVVLVARIADIYTETDGDDDDAETTYHVARQIARSTISASVGGGGSGVSGADYEGPIVTGVTWNTDGSYQVWVHTRQFKFSNGVLKSVDDADTKTMLFATTKHSEE